MKLKQNSFKALTTMTSCIRHRLASSLWFGAQTAYTASEWLKRTFCFGLNKTFS